MKNFFYTIGNSISSFDFYQRLLNQPFMASASFYAVFLLLAVLLRVLPIYISTLPRFSENVSLSLLELQKHYPAGLTLEWNGEQLSSSQEPVTIYYPAPFKEYARIHEFPEYLGHISTNADTTLPNLDAFFTITRTDVLIPASNGEIARAPIAEVIGTQNYTVTQESPNKFIEFWETNKKNYLTLFSMILPLGMYFFIAIQRVVMLCIEGFLFYLFKKISGVPWTYATSVKYAIHIFVPAELISIAAQYADVSASISFFSLTVWIYFIAVLLYPAAQVVMKRRQ